MFLLTQRRRGRRVHAENYNISHRKHRKHRNLLFHADNDNLGPAEMAEMAEIFPLFRFISVSSVIDKDNSQSDWREDIFYNGRNGNKTE